MAKSSRVKPKVSFLDAYLEGRLGSFFSLAPSETQAALARQRASPRPELASALGRYARKLGAPEEAVASIGRLEQPGSRAVVTGQQPGLLLGPIYTLSKAVTAVRLAQRLSSEDRPVVPVFWLASQDHDSAEIDHAYLLDVEERLLRPSLPFPEGQPSGRVAFTPEWQDSLEAQLLEARTPTVYRDEVLALLREAAALSDTVADVFGALLYRLLGSQGLVVLNPLEPDVAPLFGKVLARELEQPLESSRRINAAGESLSALGYAPQLGRAPGATNLFLEQRKDGQPRRELLHADVDGFYTSSGRYTSRYSKGELAELLRDEPARITPAAGLRPITQDAVLPTALLVVGPGELRYFAQLREVYALHEVAMPLVWPRATATLVEPPIRRILDKYGLTVDEVQRRPDASSQRVLLDLHGHGEVVTRCLAEMDEAVAGLLEHLGAVDPTLKRSIRRTDERLRLGVERLRSKAAAAIAKQDEITSRQLGRLERHLLPGGQPQERVLSPFSPFLKFGVRHVMARLLSLEPEGEQVLDL
ncbi:bacillithiol biosynthesis cysteine-adding enzyme BshC [soil metagenome]